MAQQFFLIFRFLWFLFSFRFDCVHFLLEQIQTSISFLFLWSFPFCCCAKLFKTSHSMKNSNCEYFRWRTNENKRHGEKIKQKAKYEMKWQKEHLIYFIVDDRMPALRFIRLLVVISFLSFDFINWSERKPLSSHNGIMCPFIVRYFHVTSVLSCHRMCSINNEHDL